MDELANYGEYSGAPSEQQTYDYAKTILSLMTREKHPEGKGLAAVQSCCQLQAASGEQTEQIRAAPWKSFPCPVPEWSSSGFLAVPPRAFHIAKPG